jgi:hypothetical protein
MIEKLNRLHIAGANEGILSISKFSRERIAEKLTDLDFIVNSISINNITEITIQIFETDSFYKLICGEAIKFLLAAAGSVERSNMTQHQNAAWQIIENYYAAYYSIHFLIRTCGISITNLDQNAINQIKINSLGLQYTGIIPTGLYTIKFNAADNTITLSKRVKNGGSHIEAWGLWEELIDRMNMSAQSDIAEYMKASILLSEHKKFIVKSTGRYTPPEIRGDINYKFEGATWYFEKHSQPTIQSIQSEILSPKYNILKSHNEIKNFLCCNNLIIALATKVFKHASMSYKRSIFRSKYNQYILQKKLLVNYLEI